MTERMKGNCYFPIAIWMLHLFIRCCTGQESSSNNIFSRHYDGEEEDHSSEQVGKIIGGSQVTAGTYPWFARPTQGFFANGAGCGGSLVSSQFVLTAAHCVSDTFGDFAGHGYQIGALCSPYTSGDNCGQTIENYSIKRKFIHPLYKGNTFTYDMALMQLDGASSITPINLDDGSFSSTYTSGRALWVTGLGSIDANGSTYSAYLKHDVLSYTDDATCAAVWKKSFEVESMICASGAEGDCYGDSGGPLLDIENDVVVGLVSFGPCATPDIPGIYSRVAGGYIWIVETICANHDNTINRVPSFCVTASLTKSPAPTSTPSSHPSSTPTASAVPSSTPSSSPSAKPTISSPPSSQPSSAPSISNMPSTSPPTPAPTMTNYFSISSRLNGQLCITPTSLKPNSNIVLSKCDKKNLQQQWRFEQTTNMVRNRFNDERCLRKNSGKLVISGCNSDIEATKFTTTLVGKNMYLNNMNLNGTNTDEYVLVKRDYIYEGVNLYVGNLEGVFELLGEMWKLNKIKTYQIKSQKSLESSRRRG